MKDLRIKKEPGKIVFALGCVLIFLLILFCNLKTPLLADDFEYSFSLADGQRIHSVKQIFPSMAAHWRNLGGRIISHFFVQLFLMLPPIVFKVINAFVFTFGLILIVLLGRKVTGNSSTWLMPLTLGFAFAAIWIFEPAFGQVNLWTDGALNYLWSTVLTLVYIFVSLRFYRTDDSDNSRRNHWAAKCVFLLLSFIVGAYSENGTVAAGAFAVAVVLLSIIVEKKRSTVLQWGSIALILVGFACMVFAPGEAHKVSEAYTAKRLLENLIGVLTGAKEFWLLWAAAVVLFITALVEKQNARVLIYAASLIFGAFASSITMTAASYVAWRCFANTTVLLTAACVVLVFALYNDKKAFVLSVTMLPMLAMLYFVTYGIRDILVTEYDIRYNESYIIQASMQDEKIAFVKPISTYSKYSPANGIVYMTEGEAPDAWPNTAVARYYGVDKIICTPYEREEYERRAALQEEQDADKQQDESAEPVANG